MIKVWLLVYIGYHAYANVPGLPSQEACEALYQKMLVNQWAGRHECIPYEIKESHGTMKWDD